jgi:TonB family protein
MKLFLIPAILIAALQTNAQPKSDTIERFYDINRVQVKIESYAWFHSVFVLKDSLWCESSYYLPGHELRLYGCYRDSLGKIPVDSFYYVHQNGFMEKKGKYTDGKKDGLWLTYHPNGVISDSSYYSNDIPVGVGISWHENATLCDSINWSSSNGTVLCWNNIGNFAAAGHYNLKHQQHGGWKYYYSNRKVASMEYYENGKLLGLQTFNEQGNLTPNQGTMTKLVIESTYPGEDKAWKLFLKSHLRYPPEAFKKEINGVVVVGFEVDELGNVSNAGALTGNKALTEEAIRLVSQSGKWTPAKYHGVPVKSYQKQTVIFSLKSRIEKSGNFLIEKYSQ